MRVFHLCSIGITLIFFTGCKDISEIAPETTRRSEPFTGEALRQVPETIYPLTRTITDVEGRTIEAKVIGKQGLQIAISKPSGIQRYIIPLERLSKADQEYFFELEDGGRFKQVKAQLDQEARLSNRTARWHMDAVAAEREAAKLNLPMLMTIMINGDEESKRLEKRLGYSKEFRNWANKNLVLCMLRVDDPTSNRTTSHSAVADRNTAAKYGVTYYGGPSVLLVRSEKNSQRILSSIALSDPENAIRTVLSALDNPVGWGSIVAREAPLKTRASVNGGPVFINSGSSGSS